MATNSKIKYFLPKLKHKDKLVYSLRNQLIVENLILTKKIFNSLQKYQK